MKNDIHPKYNTGVKVSCACGNTFETGSTVNEIKTELCSACHPFFTGKQKLVDTTRRVEKFQTRVSKKEGLGELKGKTAKKISKAIAKVAKKSEKVEKTEK